MLAGLKGPSTCSDVKYPANCSSRVNGNGSESTEKIYEPKQDKKFVRCVTVIAYVFSVSFGAILLSLYYIFIWNPYSNKAGLIQLKTTTPQPPYTTTLQPSTKSFLDETKKAMQTFEEAEKFLRTMSNKEDFSGGSQKRRRKRRARTKK